MDLLLLPSAKAARMSLYTQENAIIAPFEQGETVPISVGIIAEIPQPIGSRIYDPQDLTGWSFQAALGNGDNDPASLCNLTVASSAPTAPVQVVQVGGSGLNHKIRVTFTPTPYDGSWTIIIGGVESTSMDWDGDSADVQAAIEALSSVGTGNVLVTQETIGSYFIVFQGAKANTNMGTITTDPSGLKVISTLSGTLDLRYDAVGDLLGTDDSVQTLFAVDGTPPGGTVQKILRIPVTLYSSVIPDGGEPPNPPDAYLTATQSDARYYQKLASPVAGKYLGINSSGALAFLDAPAVDLHNPGPIGDTVPSTGAFTTLSATGAFQCDGGNVASDGSGNFGMAGGLYVTLGSVFDDGAFTTDGNGNANVNSLMTGIIAVTGAATFAQNATFAGDTVMNGTFGVFGEAGPSSKPATPTTLAGVIATLQAYHFCS